MNWRSLPRILSTGGNLDATQTSTPHGRTSAYRVGDVVRRQRSASSTRTPLGAPSREAPVESKRTNEAKKKKKKTNC